MHNTFNDERLVPGLVRGNCSKFALFHLKSFSFLSFLDILSSDLPLFLNKIVDVVVYLMTYVETNLRGSLISQVEADNNIYEVLGNTNMEMLKYENAEKVT